MNLTLERVQVDVHALADLRRSDEVRELLEKKASEAQRTLGEHYSTKSYSFAGRGGRVVAKVYANDYDARKENLESNTIIKAVLATKEAGA